MRDTIYTALAGDGTLLATLTGGVHVDTISRQRTPAAFDANGELLPCALVRIESDVQHGPYTGAAALSGRTYVLVYAYQRRGYDAIDAALDRVRALLHRAKLGTGTWDIVWGDDSADLEDQALNCAMRTSRYVVTRLV